MSVIRQPGTTAACGKRTRNATIISLRTQRPRDRELPSARREWSERRRFRSLSAPGRNRGQTRQFTVNACDPFNLPFGGESLVKAFIAEIADLFLPWREPFAPAPNACCFRIGIIGGEIGANTDHG